MKKFILFTTLLLPFILFSQHQLGADIDGEATGDYFGRSVSLNSDGTIVAIGANGNDANGRDSGHVRVYEYSGTSWSQLGDDIDGESWNDWSGYSVSLSSDGMIVAIGALLNDEGMNSDIGHVRVYQYSDGSWSQLGNDINGEDRQGYSGRSVSLNSDGTKVAIGGSNKLRVYEYSGGSWSKLGDDIVGEGAGDGSAYDKSVSLSSDGTIVAIGAPFNDGNGNSSGHVRVYQYSGGSWSQLGDDIDGEAANDWLGYSISLSDDGTILATGAPGNSNGNGNDAGHVRIYSWDGGAWSQVGNDIDGEAASDASGSSVSIDSDGSHVAIGSEYNSGNGSNSGHVRIYSWDGSAWSQVGNDIDGEDAQSLSGTSVSIDSDGSHVVIGAPGNENYASSFSGYVRVYDLVTPGILSVSLAADNSTITVNTSSSVYNSSDGSSDLEATDFALSISGGSAILTSSTPTSISKTSQSIWVLGVGLTGYPNGAETLTVTPVANSIYNGTAVMSTTQFDNTVSLNNIAPTFDAISLSVDNSSIAVTASETLYTTTGASGALVAADFAFSMSGGTATLLSTTPTSISTTGLVTTLGIGLSGTPDGDEILELNPASSTSIYDSGDAALSSTIISTGVKLFPNTITASSVTTTGATTAGSLTVDSVVIDGSTIGHSSDSDLMTLASGSLTVAGDVTVSSDSRLKSNIVALGPTLINLLQLEAKSYTMKNDAEQKQKIGLLAQEVQKVFPELVSEDKNRMLAVNYQALVPVLINAIKEQENNYNELEKSLEMLEKEILKNK
ncbi:tail fiber domain-containing protein [Flavobacteriaceae bacterium]|nr:tail fiber domain-containing protein [Flavobacteriaceae bacterium]